MIDFGTARARVLAKLNPPRHGYLHELEYVIIDELTMERTYGWVFFYDSKRHYETQALEDMLFGNAPILVTKHDGELHVTGTGRSVEDYLDNYEKTGNVHGD